MNVSNTTLVHTHRHTHTLSLSHSLIHLKTQHSAKVKPNKDKMPTAITHKSNSHNILALHPKPHTHYNLISRSKQTHTHPPTHTHTHTKKGARTNSPQQEEVSRSTRTFCRPNQYRGVVDELPALRENTHIIADSLCSGMSNHA